MKQLNQVSISSELPKFKISYPALKKLFFGENNGFKAGSTIMVSGPPGCGKSSFCSYLINDFASQGAKVLYNSLEEDAEDVRMRFERLDITPGKELYITKQTSLDEMFKDAAVIDADIVLIDSLQSHSRRAEWLSILRNLSEWCRKTGIIAIVISQTVKSGSFSGPQALAHEVDACLNFLIDKNGDRFAVMTKNRMGPTFLKFKVNLSKNGLKIIDNSSDEEISFLIRKCFEQGSKVSTKTYLKLNLSCSEDEWKQLVNEVIDRMVIEGNKFSVLEESNVKYIFLNN